ncbi:hypothetical protein K474DRAFT_1666710, partial [Panus rudis PR-1116 ss-1]
MVEHHILPNGEVHSSTATPVNTEVVNIGTCLSSDEYTSSSEESSGPQCIAHVSNAPQANDG